MLAPGFAYVMGRSNSSVTSRHVDHLSGSRAPCPLPARVRVGLSHGNLGRARDTLTAWRHREFTHTFKNPPQLSEEQALHLEAVPIDYSDIPELGEDFFRKATDRSLGARQGRVTKKPNDPNEPRPLVS